ncbi:MAG: formate--tetrahydrofolate ligase, partial [Myxococcota bacterium]
MRDIEIARIKKREMKNIKQIASQIGIREDELTLYGDFIAKVDYQSILKRTEQNRKGRLIVITATTPT